MVVVTNRCKHIIHKDNEYAPRSWFLSIWISSTPLKVTLFCRLVWRNHILTWDNLCKHKFIGLGCCILCGGGDEMVTDLFIHCSIALQIWSVIFFSCRLNFRVLCQLNIAWDGEPLGWGPEPLFHCLPSRIFERHATTVSYEGCRSMHTNYVRNLSHGWSIWNQGDNAPQTCQDVF